MKDITGYEGPLRDIKLKGHKRALKLNGSEGILRAMKPVLRAI